MKFLILFLVALVSTILQGTVAPYISIMGVKCNLILAVVVSIALVNRKPYGSVMGLIMGLIQDVLFSPIIGINALIYFVIGYVLENIEMHYSRDDIYMPVFIMALSTLGYNLLYFILMFFSAYDISLLFFIKYKLIIELIYNTLLIILSYKVISSIFVAPDIRFYRE